MQFIWIIFCTFAAEGVLMHKVSPKSATKHRLYDPETGKYLNDETMKAIEQAHDDMNRMIDDVFAGKKITIKRIK